MKLHLTIIGIILLLLAAAHLAFPKFFQWKTDLHSLSLINRQLMYVHTFFIGLTVLFMGLLCLCCAEEILNTTLGNYIAAGLAIFWGLRLIFQFFVYSPKLWRGKRFETAVHIIFSILWIYFTVIFLSIAAG